MSTHDTLTEPSLSAHRGKGREGKGSRKRKGIARFTSKTKCSLYDALRAIGLGR